MTGTGSGVDEIETPALLVDLNVLHENIRKMADYFSHAEAALRPHVKTHKCPVIARSQLKAGAIGVSCQKLGEAEVMAAAGIDNILITNEIVEPSKIQRLTALSKHRRVIVAVDDLNVAKTTSEIALRTGVIQDVVVEVDVGLNRCGVEPGKPALELAREVLKLRGLRFCGLLGYEGSFMKTPDFEERKAAVNARNKLLVDTRNLLEEVGIDVEIASAGATGTYNITGDYQGVTEVQAGSYVFMDTTYSKLKLGFGCALTVLTTVISRPTSERAVVDAGLKSITQEFGLPQAGIDGVDVLALTEEHAVLRTKSPESEIKVGDKVQLIPSHCCTTVNLHDRYYCMRDGIVEATWDVAARGKTR